MMNRYKSLGIILMMLHWAEVSLSEIIKPAGKLPEMEHTHVPESSLRASKGSESSKSRLVPLRRIMDVSSVAQPKEKRTSPQKPLEKSTNISEKSSNKDLKSAVRTESTVAGKSTIVNPVEKSSGIIRTINLAKSNPKAEGASEVVSEAVSKGDSISEEAWDSASKRFDQQDPSKSVTRGVRVEDIIEPTADYQYVASKRTNPFIPNLVLGRPKIVQKELSPNDVEIPIISPLQSFSAKQLSVIGVWEGGDGVWKALIQTPTNQGIETKLGDPAGNSGGRIMSITPDAVIVREFSIRTDGTREYRDIPLYMGSDHSSNTSEEVPGGRLILKPGASAPIIESPNAPAQGSTIINAPKLVPASVEGTLSTVVPFNSAQSESREGTAKASDGQIRQQGLVGGTDPVTGLPLAPQAALTPQAPLSATSVPGAPTNSPVSGPVGNQPVNAPANSPAVPSQSSGQSSVGASAVPSTDGIRAPIAVDPYSVQQPSAQGGSL